MMNSAIRAVVVLSTVVTLCNAQCDKIYESGVTKSDIPEILEGHNTIRKKAEEGEIPGLLQCVEVPQLAWDYPLAEEAQKIADTCVYGHVPVTDVRFSSVGQCLFQICGGSWLPKLPMWSAAFDSWYGEHEDLIFPNGTRGGDVSHIIQLIWADTKMVGCGFSSYEKPDGDTCHLYVCNYGPGGGVQGEPPCEVVD